MRRYIPILCAMAAATACAFVVGRGPDSAATPIPTIVGMPPPLPLAAGHGHPTEAPHGGHPIKLGNEE